MKKIASILVCCCMLMSLGACGGASGGWKPDDNAIPMNDTFFNPIRIESQMGDPWMYKHDGYYYYCDTFLWIPLFFDKNDSLLFLL